MSRYSSHSERYYQTISRFLFSLRGAPFILSPREIDIIEEWEERHIPLATVLEGIKTAYEYFRKNTGLRRNFSLSFCNRFVSTAYHLFKERKVGSMSVDQTRSKRVEIVKAEVKTFLKHMSKEVSFLKEIYLSILEDLSLDKVDEEALEKKDEQVNRLLVKHAAPQEMERHRQEAVNEYKTTQESDKDQIAKRSLIKTAREKHKIPYVSFFYY